MCAFFNPELTRREREKLLRHRESKGLPRARLIRGGVEVEDNSEEIRKLLANLQPKAVERGKISLDDASAGKGIGLRYSPEEYGLTKVETVEEMQERHRSEIQALKEDLERREKEAYDKGFSEGRAKGHQEGVDEVQAEYQKHVDLLLSLIHSTVDQTKSYFAQIEERLVAFAMRIARRVVGVTADEHEEVAIKLAEEAIRLATDRTKVTLRCNSKDVESLESARTSLLAISEGIKEIEIVPSARIERGGVILETANGSIDATVATMLDEIDIALRPDRGAIDGEDNA